MSVEDRELWKEMLRKSFHPGDWYMKEGDSVEVALVDEEDVESDEEENKLDPVKRAS
jgi:hypothetical protein